MDQKSISVLLSVLLASTNGVAASSMGKSQTAFFSDIEVANVLRDLGVEGKVRVEPGINGVIADPLSLTVFEANVIKTLNSFAERGEIPPQSETDKVLREMMNRAVIINEMRAGIDTEWMGRD